MTIAIVMIMTAVIIIIIIIIIRAWNSDAKSENGLHNLGNGTGAEMEMPGREAFQPATRTRTTAPTTRCTCPGALLRPSTICPRHTSSSPTVAS